MDGSYILKVISTGASAENRAELIGSSRDFNCEPQESYRTNRNMAVSGEGVKVLNLHGIASTKGVYLLVYS